MAIGISKVTKKSVSTIDPGKYTLTLQLKCWQQGADTAVDDPVVDRTIQETAKSQVAGKTAQELIDVVEADFGKQITEIITNFNDEDAKLNNNKVDTMISNLNTSFSSSSSSSSAGA